MKRQAEEASTDPQSLKKAKTDPGEQIQPLNQESASEWTKVEKRKKKKVAKSDAKAEVLYNLFD